MHGLKNICWICCLIAIIGPKIWAKTQKQDPFSGMQRQSQTVESQLTQLKEALLDPQGAFFKALSYKSSIRTTNTLTTELERQLQRYGKNLSKEEVASLTQTILSLIQLHTNTDVTQQNTVDVLAEKISDEIESVIASKQFSIFFPEEESFE